jgi:hypothetical protein
VGRAQVLGQHGCVRHLHWTLDSGKIKKLKTKKYYENTWTAWLCSTPSLDAGQLPNKKNKNKKIL